jgi:hypothetical protein
MSGLLIIEGEQGMLCLGAKGLSLREEGVLSVALDVTFFNYIPNIDSFMLCNNRVLYKLNIRRV